MLWQWAATVLLFSAVLGCFAGPFVSPPSWPINWADYVVGFSLLVGTISFVTMILALIWG